MPVSLTTMRATVEEIVAAHPGAGNPRPENYNEDGTPCCIAGHVYDALNALPECMEGSVDALAEDGWLTEIEGWTDDAIAFLSQVQAFADAGMTWATALTDATDLVWPKGKLT